MNTHKEIKKMLEDLSIYELEYIRHNLLTFAKEEKRAWYFDYMFFESDNRGECENDKIDDYIRQKIIDFGVDQLHGFVVDILEERKKEYITVGEQFIGIQNKIVCWGRDKGILDVKGQFLKVIEEYGEIQKAKNDEELLDAFGDTLVTLIILNDIVQSEKKDDTEIKMLIVATKDLEFFNTHKNYNIEQTVHINIYQENATYFSNIADKIVKTQKSDTQEHTEELHLEISKLTKNVILMSFVYNVDFIEALNFAYDTIAQRTGKTVDGVFIKEEDL